MWGSTYKAFLEYTKGIYDCGSLITDFGHAKNNKWI
jgi:hypothetical protein